MPIDYRKYPANWFKDIVPAITARSGNCCEECGRQNYSIVLSRTKRMQSMGKYIYRKEWFDYVPELLPEGAKLVTVILTVAHLDHDSTNHKVSLDRLRHWCQLCHLRYDAKSKARRRACSPFCTFPRCNLIRCIDYSGL